MKRLLSIVLCFCLAVGMMPAAAFADENELQQDQQEEMDSSGNVIESPWADFNMMSLADEPNLASEPENADYTVELDAFLNETSQEYVVCEGNRVSDAQNEWDEFTRTSEYNGSLSTNIRLSELRANLSQSGSDYTGEEKNLSDCAYDISPVDGGYHVSANVAGQRVYLNLGLQVSDASDKQGQGFPNQTTAAVITFDKDMYTEDENSPPEGAVRIKDFDNEKELEYSTWQFFTRSGDGTYYRKKIEDNNNTNRYYSACQRTPCRQRQGVVV